METTTETAVERELAIDASPETVWEFLVDPDKLASWFGSRAWLDPRPGGEYRVDVIQGHIAKGEFVELDPPRRLVHTLGGASEGGQQNPGPEGSRTNAIETGPDGAGRTPQVTA